MSARTAHWSTDPPHPWSFSSRPRRSYDRRHGASRSPSDGIEGGRPIGPRTDHRLPGRAGHVDRAGLCGRRLGGAGRGAAATRRPDQDRPRSPRIDPGGTPRPRSGGQHRAPSGPVARAPRARARWAPDQHFGAAGRREPGAARGRRRRARHRADERRPRARRDQPRRGLPAPPASRGARASDRDHALQHGAARPRERAVRPSRPDGGRAAPDRRRQAAGAVRRASLRGFRRR